MDGGRGPLPCLGFGTWPCCCVGLAGHRCPWRPEPPTRAVYRLDRWLQLGMVLARRPPGACGVRPGHRLAGAPLDAGLRPRWRTDRAGAPPAAAHLLRWRAVCEHAAAILLLMPHHPPGPPTSARHTGAGAHGGPDLLRRQRLHLGGRLCLTLRALTISDAAGHLPFFCSTVSASWTVMELLWIVLLRVL